MIVDRPLVTIGISTYNRANGYLRSALESALAQTYSNLEIVVSDNGSSDATADLLASYDDPRLRVVRQPTNIGANGNFNACLREAKGEWFLLLHDDDLIDPDMIDACLYAPVPKNVTLIRTGVRIVDGKGRITRQRHNLAQGSSAADFYLSYFAGRTEIYFCNTLFLTAVLKRAGGFQTPHNLLEDGVAIARMLERGGRREIPEVKSSFRRHESNRGRTIQIRKWCEDSTFLLNLMVRGAGEQAEEVRRRGLIFFSRQNYSRLYKSRVYTPSVYRTVFKHFECAYRPLSFLYDLYLGRRIRHIVHTLWDTA